MHPLLKFSALMAALIAIGMAMNANATKKREIEVTHEKHKEEIQALYDALFNGGPYALPEGNASMHRTRREEEFKECVLRMKEKITKLHSILAVNSFDFSSWIEDCDKDMERHDMFTAYTNPCIPFFLEAHPEARQHYETLNEIDKWHCDQAIIAIIDNFRGARSKITEMKTHAAAKTDEDEFVQNRIDARNKIKRQIERQYGITLNKKALAQCAAMDPEYFTYFFTVYLGNKEAAAHELQEYVRLFSKTIEDSCDALLEEAQSNDLHRLRILCQCIKDLSDQQKSLNKK